MGEGIFPNRPFKPLVERPHRGECLRAAPRSQVQQSAFD